MSVCVGTAYVKIIPQLSGGTSSISKALDSSGIGVTSGKSISSGIGKGLSMGKLAIGSALGNILSSAVSTVSSSVGSAISRLDTLNNFPKVMKSLGYSADDASASVNKMSSGIDGLPTTLDGISSNVQQLAASTGNLSTATDVGLAFNDMMLAGGASSDAASRAFTQFNQGISKGKFDMQDWNSIVSTAPGQMKQLAETMLGAGASTNDLREAINNGTISTDDLMSAMTDLDANGSSSFASFHDQALDATGGVATSMQNCATAVSKGIANILQAIGQSNIKAFFDSIKTVINDVFNTASAFITGLVQGIQNSGMADAFQRIADAVGPIGVSMDQVKTAAQDFGTAVANAMSYVVTALADSGLGDAINNIKESLDHIGSAAQTGFQALSDAAGPIEPVIKGIAQAVTDFTNGISQIGDGIASVFSSDSFVGDMGALGDAWNQLVTAMAPFYENVLVPLGNVVFPAIGQAIGLIVQTVVELVTIVINVITAIVTGITDLVTHIGEVPGKVEEFFMGIGETLSAPFVVAGDAIAFALTTVSTTVMDAWNAVVAFFAGIPDAIVGFFTGVGDSISSFFQSGADAITNIWNTLTSFISGIPASVLGFFTGIGDSISALFNLNGITDAFNTVVDDIRGVPDSIVGFFSDIGSRIGDAFKSISIPSLHISGSLNPADWPSQGLPSLSWYANGSIFTSAQLIGVGEAGPEAVIPLSSSRVKPFADAVAGAMGGGNGMDEVCTRLEAIEHAFSTMGVLLDGKKLVGGIATNMDNSFASRQAAAARGY